MRVLRSSQTKSIRVLLDEINLASADTLECISSLLQGPTASITLTEKGSFEPIPRHTGFRLFACMNPATDVGKRELPRNIRAKFTEIDVPPPDEDQEALIDVITHYIGHIPVDFYTKAGEVQGHYDSKGTEVICQASEVVFLSSIS